MDWIRENKQLATLMGVFLAAALGVGFLLFSSYSAYSDARQRFDVTNNSLAGLKSAELYPSEENLKKKEEAVGEYEKKVTQLNKVLLALQPAVEPITETNFQAKLKAKIAEVKELAGKTTQLPADFALGFDVYTGSLPSSADVATELSGYLDATDAVVRLLIDAQVQSIDSMVRTQLPSEGPVASDGEEEIPDANPVERRTLTLELTMDQGALQTVLNGLASPSELPYFTALRLVKVVNESLEGPLRSAMALKMTGFQSDEGEFQPPEEVQYDDDGNPIVPTGPEVIKAAKAATPDAIAVLGQEKLKAYMEIDVVNFVAPGAEETAAQ